MKVNEWMTSKVITVAPETPVREAFRTMKVRGIRHLPVVKGKKLIGIVTDRDLRRPNIVDEFKEWEQLYRLDQNIQVEDVMTTPVVSIAPEADLVQAASLLVEKKIGALPVCDDEKQIVGIISVTDVLRAFVSRV